MNTQQQKEVVCWETMRLFVGFDWARDHHDAVAVDGCGQIVLGVSFADTAEGWSQFRQELTRRAGADLSPVAVAVETNNGPAVERLVQTGCGVFPMNPKAAQRYRDRKAPSGGKSDRLDAWSFADALRTDGHGWRCLRAEDPRTQELRLLCRDEIRLIQQRTAFVNQLREALHEYYPAALEAFDDWLCPGAWAFLKAFPTPQALRKAGKRRWETFLHSHRLYRPDSYPRRLEIFGRADAFCGSPAVTRAKSRLATALAGQLQLLEKQLQEYRRAIETLFAEHPDHDVFGFLPGAAAKLGPRLLAEVGEDRERFEDAQSLQCFGGTAPVCVQSGATRWVKFRRGCNKWLRATVYLWAKLSRPQCAWAEAYYQRKRREGKTHACALRCLGQRWLKILWTLWQRRARYDEGLHMKDLVHHGSWSITMP